MISYIMSAVFHPQTDGATERANRSIAQILCTVVSNDQRDWSDNCPMVEFAINSSIHATTLHLSLTMDICCDQGSIYRLTPLSRVSNNSHNKPCGI